MPDQFDRREFLFNLSKITAGLSFVNFSLVPSFLTGCMNGTEDLKISPAGMPEGAAPPESFENLENPDHGQDYAQFAKALQETWSFYEEQFEGLLAPLALHFAQDRKDAVQILLDLQRQAIQVLRTSSITLVETTENFYHFSKNSKNSKNSTEGIEGIEKIPAFLKHEQEKIETRQEPVLASIQEMRFLLEKLSQNLNPPAVVVGGSQNFDLNFSKTRRLFQKILSEPTLQEMLTPEARAAVDRFFIEIEQIYRKDGVQGLLAVARETLDWADWTRNGAASEEEKSPLLIERYMEALLYLIFRTMYVLCDWIPVYVFWDLCMQIVNQLIINTLFAPLLFGFFPTLLLWSLICPDSDDCTEAQIKFLNLVFIINAIVFIYLAIQALLQKLFGEPINPGDSNLSSRESIQDIGRILRLAREIR